jgi:hypothetical protein
MRLLFFHAQFGQQIDDDAGLDFEFTRQITPYTTALCSWLLGFFHRSRFDAFGGFIGFREVAQRRGRT